MLGAAELALALDVMGGRDITVDVEAVDAIPRTAERTAADRATGW